MAGREDRSPIWVSKGTTRALKVISERVGRSMGDITEEALKFWVANAQFRNQRGGGPSARVRS